MTNIRWMIDVELLLQGMLDKELPQYALTLQAMQPYFVAIRTERGG
ncbi:hypothetical protein GI364_06790 [Alicyclobacillus sp. SO9]|nr:hypothetical protein GI364_06790 [Alicyclobacillus sp. SO9]